MNWLRTGQQYFCNTVAAPSGIQYHGLINQGSTCYLNSVLQVLFMTKDFREAVERHTCDNPECTDCDLKSLFEDLNKRTTYTYKITKRLGINNVYEQRDAAEYFEKILTLTSDKPSQIFHGKLTHETICSSGHTRNADGSFWHLPLELVDFQGKVYNVVSGTKKFFEESYFTGENQMYCDDCDTKCDASMKCVIKHHPDVLTLLLKRFNFDYRYMSYVKNNSPVDVPYTLEISKGQTYELYAVVDHFGDLRSGHYSASIKPQDDESWYIFNDASVRPANYQPFQENNTETSNSAYLIFYRKQKSHAAERNILPTIMENNEDQYQDAENKSKKVECGQTLQEGNVCIKTVSNDKMGNGDTVADECVVDRQRDEGKAKWNAEGGNKEETVNDQDHESRRGSNVEQERSQEPDQGVDEKEGEEMEIDVKHEEEVKTCAEEGQSTAEVVEEKDETGINGVVSHESVDVREKDEGKFIRDAEQEGAKDKEENRGPPSSDTQFEDRVDDKDHESRRGSNMEQERSQEPDQGVDEKGGKELEIDVKHEEEVKTCAEEGQSTAEAVEEKEETGINSVVCHESVDVREKDEGKFIRDAEQEGAKDKEENRGPPSSDTQFEERVDDKDCESRRRNNLGQERSQGLEKGMDEKEDEKKMEIVLNDGKEGKSRPDEVQNSAEADSIEGNKETGINSVVSHKTVGVRQTDEEKLQREGEEEGADDKEEKERLCSAETQLIQTVEDQNRGHARVDDDKQNQPEQIISVTHTTHEYVYVEGQDKEQENRHVEHIQNREGSSQSASERSKGLTENQRVFCAEKMQHLNYTEPKRPSGYREVSVMSKKVPNQMLKVTIIEEEHTTMTRTIMIRAKEDTSQNNSTAQVHNEVSTESESDLRTDEQDILSERFCSSGPGESLSSASREHRQEIITGNTQKQTETSSAVHSTHQPPDAQIQNAETYHANKKKKRM